MPEEGGAGAYFSRLMRPSRMPRPRHAKHKAQTMICHSHDSGGLTTGAGGQFAMIGSTAMLGSNIRTARRPAEPKSRHRGPAAQRFYERTAELLHIVEVQG